MTVAHAFSQALQAATALAVSHFICFGIIMYYDLSGKWAAYSINPKRSVTATDYLRGAKSFFADIACLFLPVMTFCFWYRAAEIVGTFFENIFSYKSTAFYNRRLTNHYSRHLQKRKTQS